METQWKKTLEILTNPSKRRPLELESNEVSVSDNNQQFQNQQAMNNLSHSEENLKSEMLRNYIDMVNVFEINLGRLGSVHRRCHAGFFIRPSFI